MDCQSIVEVNKALRPNRRKSTAGEALMKESTMEFDRPGVRMATEGGHL